MQNQNPLRYLFGQKRAYSRKSAQDRVVLLMFIVAETISLLF